MIGEGPVMVRADGFSLREAGRNLLVNALIHGQAPVAIGASVQGKEATLWVEDSGPGIPPQIEGSLGARFQRSTASREDSVGTEVVPLNFADLISPTGPKGALSPSREMLGVVDF